MQAFKRAYQLLIAGLPTGEQHGSPDSHDSGISAFGGVGRKTTLQSVEIIDELMISRGVRPIVVVPRLEDQAARRLLIQGNEDIVISAGIEIG